MTEKNLGITFAAKPEMIPQNAASSVILSLHTLMNATAPPGGREHRADKIGNPEDVGWHEQTGEQSDKTYQHHHTPAELQHFPVIIYPPIQEYRCLD